MQVSPIYPPIQLLLLHPSQTHLGTFICGKHTKCVRQIRNTLNIWYYVFSKGGDRRFQQLCHFPLIVFNRKQKRSASAWALWYKRALGGFQPDPGIPAADCPPNQNPFSLPLCYLGAWFCKVQCLLARSEESLECFLNRKHIWSLPGVCGQGFCIPQHAGAGVTISSWGRALIHFSAFQWNKASLPEKICHVSKSTELPYSVLCPKLQLGIHPPSSLNS